MKSEEKKASSGNAPRRGAISGSAPRPPEEDGPKCPAAIKKNVSRSIY